MSTLATGQSDVAWLADLHARTERLGALIDETQDAYVAALCALRGASSPEAEALRLVILNAGGNFVGAMEQAWTVGTETVATWEAVHAAETADGVGVDDEAAQLVKDEGTRPF